jgi:hypothetical protein
MQIQGAFPDSQERNESSKRRLGQTHEWEFKVRLTCTWNQERGQLMQVEIKMVHVDES